MPNTHSELFNTVTNEEGSNQPPVTIRSDILLRFISDGSISYGEYADLLREVNDSQFGIVSNLNPEGHWVRDATASIPLSNRISHESPTIEGNNALLRCLSRLRAIDHAIEKSKPDNAAILRNGMKDELIAITTKILNINSKPQRVDTEKLDEITQLEKDFDTFLIKSLYEANLTQGITTPEEAEKLLFHYRNLSSLLTPARPLVTLTYDKDAEVLQRETQYPVTKKTRSQKEEIAKLSDINSSPLSVDKTAHTRHRVGMQQADALFSEFMLKDDRSLGAQARKTHLAGAKNAFIVKNELVKGANIGPDVNFEQAFNSPEAKTLWLGRTGSPVYVGKGESAERLLMHTRENMEQIREKALELTGKDMLNIHLTTLNTYSFLENQSTIINNLYDATRRDVRNGDNISYAPTNPDGTFRRLDVADGLYDAHDPEKPTGSAPLDKATRVDSVSKIMLKASQKENTFSLVNCASGQDRTGTAIEKTTQRWMEKCYEEWTLDKSNIQTMRAEGGNAAEITTHHIHGSPGMKTDSKAGNTFSAEASEAFYLKSAKTNKKNPVDDVNFLRKPSELAIKDFMKNLNAFSATLLDEYLTEGNDDKNKLHTSGTQVLADIKNLVGNPLTIENVKKNVDSKTLSTLNLMTSACNHMMKNPSDIKTARKLAGLSKSIPGKGSSALRTLGKGLLVFACLALVTAGVLAAIPSGGSSMLLTAIGAAGLSATTASVAGFSAVTATATIGAATLNAGKKGELGKSFKDFKSALGEIKKTEENDTEEEQYVNPPKSP